METNIIEELFSLQKIEKKQGNLKPEKISPNFFKKISEEIKKIKKQIEKSDPSSEETKNLQENLNNIKNLLRDIMIIRITKILNCLVLQSKEGLNIINEKELQEEEKVFYKIANKVISTYINEVVKKMINGETPNEEALISIFENDDIKSKSKDKTIITIKQDFVPKVLASGNKTYGPMFYGDILIISKTIAERLLNTKQKIAEEIIKNQ
ncbi:MAG: hypothetical protein QXP34_02565 [Candidatus Aenigmatarchaeota archaeon]